MSYTFILQEILLLYTHICFVYMYASNFNWYKFQLVFSFSYIHIYDLIVLVLQYLYIFKVQIMFMLSLILFQMLIGIFTSLCIDFNWYLFGIKMYFMFHLQLVSKSTIGILKKNSSDTNFCFVNYNLISLISKSILLTSRKFKIYLKSDLKMF